MTTVRFCGNCGTPLDNNKKFCTRCGHHNPFYNQPAGTLVPPPTNSELDQLRQQKERIERELAEKEQQEKERIRKQVELLRLEEERKKQEQLEAAARIEAEVRLRLEEEKRKADLERLKAQEVLRIQQEEQLKAEREQKEVEMKRKYDEEQAQLLFNEEKKNTLELIRQERERLKKELDEVQQLRQLAGKVSVDSEVPPATTKRKWVSAVGWLLFMLGLIGALAGGAFYFYNQQKAETSIALVSAAISNKDWQNASGYLSGAFKDHYAGKHQLTPAEIVSLKIWGKYLPLLITEMPKARQAIVSPLPITAYKVRTDNLMKLRLNEIKQANLPGVNAAETGLEIELTLDSFNLLHLNRYLTEISKIKKTSAGLVYLSDNVSMNIDSCLAMVANPNHVAIEPLYKIVAQQMLAYNNVPEANSIVAKPVNTVKKKPVSASGNAAPTVTPVSSQRDAD
jgi:hypothetical protein